MKKKAQNFKTLTHNLLKLKINKYFNKIYHLNGKFLLMKTKIKKLIKSKNKPNLKFKKIFSILMIT